MLLIIISVFVFCFVLERVIPGWRLPQVRTWPTRVLAINAAGRLQLSRPGVAKPFPASG